MTGEELREWRIKTGLSQLRFGLMLPGEPIPQTISAWENGLRPVPDWMDAVKFQWEHKQND